MKATDAKRLNSLVKKAGSVPGFRLENLDVHEKIMLKKFYAQPLSPHAHFYDGPSEYTQRKRLVASRCRTKRHRKSFLPVPIRLYNSSVSVCDLF